MEECHFNMSETKQKSKPWVSMSYQEFDCFAN